MTPTATRLDEAIERQSAQERARLQELAEARAAEEAAHREWYALSADTTPSRTLDRTRDRLARIRAAWLRYEHLAERRIELEAQTGVNAGEREIVALREQLAQEQQLAREQPCPEPATSTDEAVQRRQALLADYRHAGRALAAAEVELERLKAALQTDQEAQQVEALRRHWCELMDRYNQREIYQPPPPTRDRNAWEPPWPAEQAQMIEAQRAAYAQRDEQMLAEVRAAEQDYSAAADKLLRRQAEFAENPIHLEVERLRQSRDAATAALNRDATLATFNR